MEKVSRQEGRALRAAKTTISAKKLKTMTKTKVRHNLSHFALLHKIHLLFAKFVING